MRNYYKMATLKFPNNVSKMWFWIYCITFVDMLKVNPLQSSIIADFNHSLLIVSVCTSSIMSVVLHLTPV